jgi:molybdopterin-guanine dinucleotide biosynthesis protein A
VLIDGVVLTGGRASRLSGTPKAGLLVSGRTLLEHTITALRLCRHIAVVGAVPEGVLLPPRIQVTREDPLFGGPAAGVAAGAALLASIVHHHSDVTLVLACDIPGVSDAVPLLLDALATDAGGDGVIAVDSTGTPNPLVAAYRTNSLRRALAAHPAADGLSMRSLIESLDLTAVPVPDQYLDDVDTWADAARFGIVVPPGVVTRPESAAGPDHTTAPSTDASAPAAHPAPSAADTDAALARWSEELARELGLSGVEIDITSILSLAGKVAHAVVRPAAPLTTFLVGYAAGQAATGALSAHDAITAASTAALRLSAEYGSATTTEASSTPLSPAP